MPDENQVSIILLTGASCSGKSHLGAAVSNQGIPVLDNDHEIMRRIFDLLPNESHRRLHEHIGDENAWKHIRLAVDFERLVRLHHRDWFLRNGCPKSFVAVGWMYSRRDHRQQVCSAFSQLANYIVRLKIARLVPQECDFIQRYCERQDKANTHPWQDITLRGPDARARHAKEMYQRYLKDDWQAPVDGATCVDVQDVEGVLKLSREINSPFATG